MTDKRLSEADLRDLDLFAEYEMRDVGPVEMPLLVHLLAEVRMWRALFATPFPCGHDEPTVYVQRGHGATDVVQWDGETYEPEDAIGIGAALVRAGRAAQGKDGAR